MLDAVPRRAFVPPELTSRSFTIEEALGHGLTAAQLRGASWCRVSRGVYIWRGVENDIGIAIAGVARTLPPDAVLTGMTALWLHGLGVSAGPPFEVIVPHGSGVGSRSGLYIRHAALAEYETVTCRGLRVTSVERSLLDLAHRLPLVEAVVIADMALQHRLIDMAQLRAYPSRRRRCAGIAALRCVVELADPRAESAMETRLRLLLSLGGLPRPEAQVELRDEEGRFLARADLYYPSHRLLLEYDGQTHRDSLVQDNRRQNELLNAGFRLLRFTAADVLSTPDRTLALVRSQLSQRVG